MANEIWNMHTDAAALKAASQSAMYSAIKTGPSCVCVCRVSVRVHQAHSNPALEIAVLAKRTRAPTPGHPSHHSLFSPSTENEASAAVVF